MNKTAKAARNLKVRKWKQNRLTGSYNGLEECRTARRNTDKKYKQTKRQVEMRIAEDVKKNPMSF